MYRKVLMICGLALSMMLVGCAAPQPGSEEVAEAMKRISFGMEAQQIDLWAPAEVTVLLGESTIGGEVLQLRLSDLQVQVQQPPAMPGLRLVGQMHIVNRRTGDNDTVMLVNYAPTFRTDEGEAITVEPDEAYPLLEKVEPGGELAVEFKALVPSIGEEVETIRPKPEIAKLDIVINYGIENTQGSETFTFPLTFGTE